MEAELPSELNMWSSCGRTVLRRKNVRDYQESDEVIGVILGSLSFPAVVDILRSVSDRTITLFNSTGTEIGSNGFSGSRAGTLSEKNFSAFREKVGSTKEGSLISFDEKTKEEILVSYATERGFENFRGNGWILTMEVPASVVTAPALQTAVTLVVLLSVIIFLSTLFVLFFVRSFLKPIGVLTILSQKIAEGDLNQKVLVDSHDEIGTLGTVFNNMTQRLKESYTILETKVKERTTELETERGSLEHKVKERTAELEKLKNGLEQTVLERTQTLQTKMAETERMNQAMTGRELRMIELKKEIKELKARLGEAETPEEGVAG